MKKTRIVILGDNASTHIQKWIKAIEADAEIELHVISMLDGIRLEGVTYHMLKEYTKTRVDYLLNVLKVRSILKKVQPDILHAHYATSYGLLGAISGVHPYIITGWGADIFDSPANPILRFFLKYTFRKADGITVLTEVTRQEIKKLTPKPVDLIPFGVDLKKFKPSENKVEDGVVRFGTIRTLSEKYGVEYLIRGFAEVEKKYKDVFLEIVGDGELRQSLEQLVMQLGIQEKVKFHGFVGQNNDFQKYMSILQNLDVFAILSILDSETFGVAGVEASACGIPVLASRVGGLVEVIADNETGLLVPAKNVEETATAMEKLILNPELRRKLGQNGRKRVEEKYDWDKNTQQMISIYRFWAAQNSK